MALWRRHRPADLIVRWHKLSAALRRSRPARVGREVNLLVEWSRRQADSGRFQCDYRATCWSLASSASSGQSCSGRNGSPSAWTIRYGGHPRA